MSKKNDNNPQTKVKYTKVNESKGEEREEKNPPPNFDIEIFLSKIIEYVNTNFRKEFRRAHFNGVPERNFYNFVAKEIFTEHEIFQTFENIKNDEWAKKKGYSMVNPNWISKEETINQYIFSSKPGNENNTERKETPDERADRWIREMEEEDRLKKLNEDH